MEDVDQVLSVGSRFHHSCSGWMDVAFVAQIGVSPLPVSPLPSRWKMNGGRFPTLSQPFRAIDQWAVTLPVIAFLT